MNIFSVPVFLLLLASVCVAQPTSTTQRPQAAISPLPDELRSQLALTAVQINAIVRLHEQYRQDSVELRARLADLRAAQRIAEPAFKKPGLRTEVPGNPELATAAQRIEAVRARYRSAVRSLLSEAQRASLDRLERAAALQPVIEQAQCFALLMKTPPDEPAACGEYQREP
ncbi:MAG: Spy/CpxP family protein refolding chaperone [Pseudomonadota bacterium]|nr:Spy/CpxP family protein refolding chaperone [Pseudomonadota bacterium]